MPRMAKVLSPLHSLDAAGSLTRQIIYGFANGKHIAKIWHQPHGAPTTLQSARRALYASGVAAWNALDASARTRWKTTGDESRISGFNAFISNWLRHPPAPPGIQWDDGTPVWDDGTTIWIE